jgi:hypothetical protein
MALNSYFNQVSFAPEQALVQDLIEEAIQIYGHDVYYIRRDVVNMDTLIGEDNLQSFSEAWPIEMYIKTHDSFQGQSEFVSKFGLIIEDRIDLSVSIRRFHQTVPNMLRPREGDLIWIQMSPVCRYIFDIRFVENQEQMYQLGKLYTYELHCERMNFSHERVTTPEVIINQGPQRDAYTIDVLLGAGTGDYNNEEQVYQGDNYAVATATGMVVSWDSEVSVLSLQNITGTFSNALPVIGVDSGASYLPLATPLTTPIAHDPISDNQELQTDSPSVLVDRGKNPRYS